MRISCAGYSALVARLRDAAGQLCDGRLVLALEGGYDLTALAWSILVANLVASATCAASRLGAVPKP